MRHLVPAVTIFVFLAADVAIRAHHGYVAFFDPRERTVAVEGNLENLRYGNPHVVMIIRAADSTLYVITWQAASWLERYAGISKSTFSIGDRLLIVGAPSRDPAWREVTLVREVRRPRDGWHWRSSAPFAPPS